RLQLVIVELLLLLQLLLSLSREVLLQHLTRLIDQLLLRLGRLPLALLRLAAQLLAIEVLIGRTLIGVARRRQRLQVAEGALAGLGVGLRQRGGGRKDDERDQYRG